MVSHHLPRRVFFSVSFELHLVKKYQLLLTVDMNLTVDILLICMYHSNKFTALKLYVTSLIKNDVFITVVFYIINITVASLVSYLGSISLCIRLYSIMYDGIPFELKILCPMGIFLHMQTTTKVFF